MESEKRKKSFAGWIGGPVKMHLSKEGEEEDVSAPLASTEDGYTIYRDNEGREDEREDDHEDTVLYDDKYNGE